MGADWLIATCDPSIHCRMVRRNAKALEREMIWRKKCQFIFLIITSSIHRSKYGPWRNGDTLFRCPLPAKPSRLQ